VRTGIFISAVSHIALVAFVLLGTPRLFDNVPLETIEVDLVREQDLEPEPPPLEPEKKPPDKTKEWSPFPEAAAAPAKPPAAENASPETKQKQPQPTQQARARQPSPKEPTTPQTNTPPQTPPAERPTQQALAPQSPLAEPPAQQSQPWIFDPVNIPALMNLPNGPQADFDSEATTTANLSGDDRSAFKEHLKKCWKLPDGMSTEQSTKVTLRIFLKRDGGLAGEPMLIEASASRDGPRLMQAAILSVKACQPFGFLPVDRYREWKALDVTFSPKEMAGG
jgi:outer membrane biosynthesis protein TonB